MDPHRYVLYAARVPANGADADGSGSIAEQMGDVDRALNAYEHAIRHNPESVPAHLRVASIARSRDDFVRVRLNLLSSYFFYSLKPQAIDHWQHVLGLESENGEVWSALGQYMRVTLITGYSHQP